MAELVMPRIPKGDSVIPRRKRKRKRKRQTNRYLPFILNDDFMIIRKRPRVKRFGGALFEEDSKGFFVPLDKPRAPKRRKPRSKQRRGLGVKRKTVRADPLRESGDKRFGKKLFAEKSPVGKKARRKGREKRKAKKQQPPVQSVMDLFASDDESTDSQGSL